MAIYEQSRGRLAEAEPMGLLTEGAAGIAVIVLAIIALAGVSVEKLASIATIVIGAGLLVQGFNSAAEHMKAVTVHTAGTTATQTTMVQAAGEPTGDIMVDFLAGVTGIVLGILALIGLNAVHLIPAALIVFGASLLLSGALSFSERMSAAAGGIEVLTGLAAVVLGILSLVAPTSWILVLVGFLAVGAAMLAVSASFSGAVTRFLTTTTA